MEQSTVEQQNKGQNIAFLLFAPVNAPFLHPRRTILITDLCTIGITTWYQGKDPLRILYNSRRCENWNGCTVNSQTRTMMVVADVHLRLRPLFRRGSEREPLILHLYPLPLFLAVSICMEVWDVAKPFS